MYLDVRHQQLIRHNRIAAQIHVDICKHYAIKVYAKSWYEHKSNRVTENEQVTILWYSQIITDRHISHNKSDIIIKEEETDMYMIIDVSIPSDYNIQKATEKITKYVNLQVECQRMWDKTVEVVPIIT